MLLDDCVNPVTIIRSFCLAEELKKLRAADDEEETLQQVRLLMNVYAQVFVLQSASFWKFWPREESFSCDCYSHAFT